MLKLGLKRKKNSKERKKEIKKYKFVIVWFMLNWEGFV